MATIVVDKVSILAKPGLFGIAEPAPDHGKVLVATNDSELYRNLDQIIEARGSNSVWARTLEEVKTSLRRKNITACLSGFWLVDATYRDIVRHMAVHAAKIPLVVICPTSCPREQYDLLVNLNIRSFRFVPHPYDAADLHDLLFPEGSPETVSEPSELPLPGNGGLAFPVLRRAT